jgi:hypothetical protein
MFHGFQFWDDRLRQLLIGKCLPSALSEIHFSLYGDPKENDELQSLIAPKAHRSGEA